MAKKVIVLKMGQIVVPVSKELKLRINQAAKKQGLKLAPYVRNLLVYVMESNPKDIYVKMNETRLKAELDLINKQANEIIQRKEKLERELEAVNA